METRTHEIAPGIHRLSTYVPEVAPPAGFTFNQFLIDAEEPLLFHCGQRMLFPLVSAVLFRIIPVDRLKWISFGHIEADECGALNLWLKAAPNAQVIYSELGCQISVTDLADRPPRPLAPGEILDLGGKRVQLIPTPHVPHGWEAQTLFEETTRTLFCGDLFTQLGPEPVITRDDLVGAAMMAEQAFQATSITPNTGRTIRELADLGPERLALMHGPTFEGDAKAQLLALASEYEKLLAAQLQHA